MRLDAQGAILATGGQVQGEGEQEKRSNEAWVVHRGSHAVCVEMVQVQLLVCVCTSAIDRS